MMIDKISLLINQIAASKISVLICIEKLFIEKQDICLKGVDIFKQTNTCIMKKAEESFFHL